MTVLQPLGSTLGEHTHKGTGQAGNKSLLSYRTDTGVPGYTGFISGQHSIEVPIKGSTVHTGRAVDKETWKRAATMTHMHRNNSVYMSQYGRKTEAALDAGTLRTEGGYWIRDRVAKNLEGSQKPFSGTSTYRTELLKGTVPREAVEAPQAVANEDTKGLGYTTTYGMMSRVTPTKIGGAEGNDGAAAPLTLPRTARLKQTCRPRFEGTSVYSMAHGTFGSDPMARAAATEKEVSQKASTAEFFAGTTKSSAQIPGYGGFLPSAQNNELAVTAALGADTRKSTKDAMTLFDLDQYSRETLPHYGGFRARAPRNIRSLQEPTTQTTQGDVNFQTTRVAVKPADPAHFRKSEAGTMSFFTAGSVNVSDNGRSNAERYYQMLRPREGLPRIFYPSQTTAAGYKFRE